MPGGRIESGPERWTNTGQSVVSTYKTFVFPPRSQSEIPGAMFCADRVLTTGICRYLELPLHGVRISAIPWAEAFNTFNHTQLNNPPVSNLNIDLPSAGRITTAKDPRIGQFALKLYF